MVNRANTNAARGEERCWKRSKTRGTRSSGCCRVHDDAVSSVYRGDVGQLSTSIECHTSPSLPPPLLRNRHVGIYSRRVLSRVVRWTLRLLFLPFPPFFPRGILRNLPPDFTSVYLFRFADDPVWQIIIWISRVASVRDNWIERCFNNLFFFFSFNLGRLGGFTMIR